MNTDESRTTSHESRLRQQRRDAWQKSAAARRGRFLAVARVAGDLRRQSWSIKKIARRLKVSTATVGKMVARVGARLPADRFRCGHAKAPGNFVWNGNGRVKCRECHNEQALRYHYRKSGRTLCRLAQAWRPSSRQPPAVSNN